MHVHSLKIKMISFKYNENSIKSWFRFLPFSVLTLLLKYNGILAR